MILVDDRVRAALQRLSFATLRAAAQEHERYFGPGRTHHLQRLEAREPWKHHVRHDDVGTEGLDRLAQLVLERHGARLELKSRFLEPAGRDEDVVLAVIDEQDPYDRHS